MSRKGLMLALLALLTMTVLAACGGMNVPSAADAQKAVCQSLSGVATNVDKLATVDPNTTVADLKALKTQVDGVVSSVRTANQVLNLAQVTDLVTAYDGLAAQLNGLSDNATLDEATVTRIKGAVARVQDTLTKASSSLNCTP